MSIFKTHVHEVEVTENGTTESNYDRGYHLFGKGFNADGDTLGGFNWDEHDGHAHVVFFDAVHGTRLTYDIDENGDFIKHETSRHKIDGSHHTPGCYSKECDEERGYDSAAEALEHHDYHALHQMGYHEDNYGNWKK